MSPPDTPVAPRTSQRVTPFAWLWMLPPAIVGLLVLGWILMLSLSHDRWDAYNWTLELAQWPVFFDLHVIQEGMRLHSQGIDPLAADTLSQGFAYNYPRLWLEFSHLGLHRFPLPWTGFILGVAWLATLVGINQIRSAGLSAIMTLALLSPPVTLALERGNIDLVLFILCMLASMAWRRPSVPWLSPGLVTLGSMLKLYPAAALALAGFDLKNQSRRLWWLAASVLISGFWLTRIEELGLIGSKTPRVTGASFGCAVVPMRYAHHLEDLFISNIPLAAILAGSLALCALWLGLAAWVGIRLAPSFVQLNVPKMEVTTFYMMAAIWVGTFALGNNFAYRLIFVLPCLPLLWRLCTTGGVPPPLYQWAALTLGTAFVTFSAPLNAIGRTFVFVQAASWLLTGALAAGCCGLLKASWMKQPSMVETKT